jgi:hypothetical protein
MPRYAQFSVGELTADTILNGDGNDITYGANPSGGMDYFVDNNYGSSAGTGLSWASPKKTLAQAITLSNANVAADARNYGRGWATRNRIFYRADTETADLVIWPNKCDVIGVGSYDANTQPGITGNHVPANAANYGTRFFNIWFKAPADASPIVTLASTTSGAQFIGCTFDATATTTTGITATASPFLKVIGCRFQGAFVTAAISIGAGEAGGTLIKDNDITQSAAVGILVNASTTASWPFIVKDNFIQAATLVIDDNSDSGTGIIYVTGNKLISLAASTTAYAENVDINIGRAAGNYLTTPNIATVYPILDTTT